VKRLIVTADDFGLAPAVNDAVEAAHRRGILSAASLMVTAPAAADAVARAKRLPRLAVGLHLVLVDGRPASPPAAIPALVGGDGQFHGDLLRVGIRIFCLPEARRQVETEIRAQLETFRRTGLKLDHVNAHHHFHLHPTVADALLRLAPEYGIAAVRVPLEHPLESWRAAGDRLGSRLGVWLLQASRTRRLQRRLRAAGIACNDCVLGLSDTGAMTKERVRRYLARLPDGVSELYVHAATARPDAWPAHYQAQAELEALIDPEVRDLLKAQGIEPIAFASLKAAA
jgi:chitin disaccharide deacetylase